MSRYQWDSWEDNHLSERMEQKLDILYKFEILWSKWECDSDAWIVKDKDKNIRLIMTNHGSPYFAEKKALIERLDAYQKVINSTNKAIYLLEERL